MRSDKRRSFLLRNPTDSEWFSCFMTGFEARVGQRTKQDMAISIEVMMEIERLNQEQWAEAEAVAMMTYPGCERWPNGVAFQLMLSVIAFGFMRW
jgi:hypothetical protein